ncbi:MAG: orotidine-5'-phosphate decarboxylase [Pseudomonadota bacterium]
MSDHMVIVALDYSDPAQAVQFVEKVSPNLCALKVGFELFLSGGPTLVEALVAKDFKVFLDLKFHDIPNTVAQACTAAANMGVWMMNLHASGGSEMMCRALEAIDKYPSDSRPKLIAVTVLTSMSQEDLSNIGVNDDVTTVVKKWALSAFNADLDGVVCSAQESSMIRQSTDKEFLIVTPGIRLPIDDVNDQKRIVTPSDARLNGSSHIVVGRPITKAEDPIEALNTFNKAFSCA